MIFNQTEANKAISANSEGYSKLETEYQTIHAKREQAAFELITAEKQNNESAIETAKQNYRNAEKEFNATRKNATEFIKTTNNDKNFNDVNYVFPMFVVQNMPMGVIGLIIAAIFAAAMSSIAAELNSLATASTIDFYKRHFKTEMERINNLFYSADLQHSSGGFSPVSWRFLQRISAL